MTLPGFDQADARLRDDYNAALDELRGIVGPARASELAANPHGHGESRHVDYLLTVMCNRRCEASSNAAHRRRMAARTRGRVLMAAE